MKLSILSLCVAAIITAAAGLADSAPKYVFLFIGDGMSLVQRGNADEFSFVNGKGHLAINSLPVHSITRTCSASSTTTDSAAAATAIACGEKTYNGAVGLDSSKKPLESVAYVAQRAGRKVGIATTMTICHATPACFYARRTNRALSYQIALDLLDSGFDFFAGGALGGKANDKSDPCYKGNIYELAPAAGYSIVKGRDAFLALTNSSAKVWFQASEGYMRYALDNDGSEPTLAEITAKGIELLDNPSGFFFMVEGGNIDAAGHANDPAPNMHAVLDFDSAVKVALSFMEKHPSDTLIIVTGDHETGGMTLGTSGTGYEYSMRRLAYQRHSAYIFREILTKKAKAAEKAGSPLSFADTLPLLHENFGFVFPSAPAPANKGPDKTMTVRDDEFAELEEAFVAGTLPEAARAIMSRKCGIGWTTGGHSAVPVITTSGGKCSELFSGFMENTDISNRLKKLYTSED